MAFLIAMVGPGLAPAKPGTFRETNLFEEEVGPADQKTLRVSPYQIKTLKLQP